MALEKFQPYLFVSAGEQSNKYLTPVISPEGIASFQAQRAQDLTGLTVRIDPVQEGTGDPSPTNIRPISGRTGMTVTRAGKNLLENTATNATRYGVTLTVADNGTITANGTATSGFDFVIWDSGDVTKGFKGEFVLNGCLGGTASTYRLVARVRNTDLNTNRYVIAANGDATVVTSENEVINRVVLSVNNGSELSNVKVSPMLRPATITDDTYEPYTGTTIPITWESIAGTVYGGTLDVVSGVLTVDWSYIASYDGETLPGEWISDRDVYAEGTTPTTGAEVAYKLAEPVTYQLTQTDIRTLAGVNQIYSDAGPVIDIKF